MKFNHCFCRLVVGGLILLFALTADAANVRGQLVYASDNSAAPYVAVRLNSTSKGASEFAYSGADGRYFIKNVPAGDYQLEVWRGGRIVLTIPITVREPDSVVELVRVP
jgi:hypothetical protein